MMSGLRLQELLRLEYHHVDTREAVIFVHQGKGRKDRLVPIYPRLMPILLEYRSLKDEQGKPSPWFFTGLHSDKRLYPKDIYRICRALGRLAKVKFTPHMLRHTLARELGDNDLDVMKIKEILGHAQVTTTQRYMALSHQRMRKSIEQVQIY